MNRLQEALSLQPMAKRRKTSSSTVSRSSTSVPAGSNTKIRSKRDRKLDRTVHLFSTVLGGNGITREEYLALTIAPRVRARVRLLGGDVTIDSYCVIPGLVPRDAQRNLSLWKYRFKENPCNLLDLFFWMEKLENLREIDFVEHGRTWFWPNDEIPTIVSIHCSSVTIGHISFTRSSGHCAFYIAVESAPFPSRDLFDKAVNDTKYYVNVIDRSRKRRQRRLSRKSNDTLWGDEYDSGNELYSRWLRDRRQLATSWFVEVTDLYERNDILNRKDRNVVSKMYKGPRGRRGRYRCLLDARQLTNWFVVWTGLDGQSDVLNGKNHNIVSETYKGPRGRRRRYRCLRERLIVRADEVDTFNLNGLFANSSTI